jgi:hypothetical protein
MANGEIAEERTGNTGEIKASNRKQKIENRKRF